VRQRPPRRDLAVDLVQGPEQIGAVEPAGRAVERARAQLEVDRGADRNERDQPRVVRLGGPAQRDVTAERDPDQRQPLGARQRLGRGDPRQVGGEAGVVEVAPLPVAAALVERERGPAVAAELALERRQVDALGRAAEPVQEQRRAPSVAGAAQPPGDVDGADLGVLDRQPERLGPRLRRDRREAGTRRRSDRPEVAREPRHRPR